MKTQELRIGNYINYLGVATIVESIAGIDQSYLATKSSGIMPINLFQPIPLTEELLFKIGAERFGNGDLNINGHLISWMDCRKIFVHRATSVELKFLHIWQNLYFALSGEELLIK